MHEGTVQYEFVIEVPITVYIQPEELEELKAERDLQVERAMANRWSARGITLPRVIMERAKEHVIEYLKVGRTQYEGALFVVESREAN